jgi:hypothetical protein
MLPDPLTFILSIRSWSLISCALIGLWCDPLPQGVYWDRKSGVFEWWSGKVTLPPRFSYQTDPTDTFEGHFTSPDGKLVIRHDIGSYAGAWAHRDDTHSYEEWIVGGARVWTGRRPWGRERSSILVAVTFPDSGCANFYVEYATEEDAEVIKSIAKSFRPKGISNGDYCP